MSARKRLLLLPTVCAVLAALLWTTVGSIDIAAAKTQQIIISRAHEGSLAPTFNDPIFILMLGGDARKGNPERTRTDSIHIVAIVPGDPTDPTKPPRASILGIPRDSWVEVPGFGMHKITEAGYYGGPQLVEKVVANKSGCKFDYWMQTSFGDFKSLVNDFGGIPIFVKEKNGLHEQTHSRVNLSHGKHHLNGDQALSYARARHARPRGDFDRSVAQGELMLGALKQARINYVGSAGTALHALAIMRRHLKLNIPLDEALKLGLLALKIKPENVKNIVIDGNFPKIPGAGSVVGITAQGQAQLLDICDDGILQNS